jgi:hypothetical protein
MASVDKQFKRIAIIFGNEEPSWVNEFVNTFHKSF